MKSIVNTGNLRKVFLFFGILSSVLYVGADIIASVYWKEVYNYNSQAFSELLAFGATTRSFVLSLNVLYNAIVIVFGLCVRATETKGSFLKITGILLVGYAIVGIVTPTFFPAPMRGVEATVRNSMHIPLTGVLVLFILLSIGFGAAALGKGFRLYSIFSILVLTLCGVWAGGFISLLEANQPTPWLGIIERVNIYGYMLWVIVFAILLIRMENGHKSVKGIDAETVP